MAETVYRLVMGGFPLVDSLDSLSRHTCLSQRLLYVLSARNSNFYRRFYRPKKSGGQREILAPSRQMKALQAWILRHILEKVPVHDAATAFRSGRNIALNAEPHQSNRWFLCLDFDDFFPSIPYAKVYTVFRTIGYNSHIAHVLTALCTCDGKLPQGAVTSPTLSNIICLRLDRRISGFAGKRNIAYTRYADDMTFSSMNPNKLIGAKRMVHRIAAEEGFTLNESKTRYMGPRQQCRVTSLVIADNSVGVGKKRKRKLRAAMHRLVARNLPKEEREILGLHIHGWLAFVQDVDHKRYAQLKTYSAKLSKRYHTTHST